VADSILLNDCCGNGATEKYNPKAAPSRRARYLRFASPQNPVPAQITDAGELKAFFSKYGDVYVPYSSSDEGTGHALQSFLLSLADLSATQNAVIRSQRSHAFGGPVGIEEKTDPVYNLGEKRELSEAEKRTYYEFVKTVLVFGADDQRINFRTLAQYQFNDWKGAGQYFFEMVRTETLGVRSFMTHTHSPLNCLYLATDKGEQRFIAISPEWTLGYTQKHPPRILPLYPTWARDPDGTERTIVHVKHGNYPWYGRPDSIASILDQFFEFQNADYKNKQTASAFIGQVFIEVEDENPEYSLGNDTANEDGFSDLAEQFGQNYTNEAMRPQRVVLATRPYGSQPAHIFQFSPNTNENWFVQTEQIAENNIIKANAWSKRLMDLDVSNGLSTDVYLDVFSIFSATVINDIQEGISDPINNIILAEAARWYEMPDMESYSLEFSSPMSKLIKQRQEAQGNANNNDGGGGSTAQPGNE